jgi:hypothetical protein
MAAIDYMKSHQPPQEMVGYVFQGLGISAPGPGTVFFIAAACSGFTHWLEQDHGQVWSYLINGVQHEMPGPWETLSLQDGNVAHPLPLDRVSIWHKCRPQISIGEAPINSGEFVGYVLSSMSQEMRNLGEPFTIVTLKGAKKAYIPDAMLPLIPSNIATADDAIAFLSGVIAHAAAAWMFTDIGRTWMFYGGPTPPDKYLNGDRIQKAIASISGVRSLLAAVNEFDGSVLAYRGGASAPLTPITQPLAVIRTQTVSEHRCEQCGEEQPCIKVDRNNQYLCSRCAGYVHQGSYHDICSTCDRSPDHPAKCSHWMDFYKYAGNKRLLPAPR